MSASAPAPVHDYSPPPPPQYRRRKILAWGGGILAAVLMLVAASGYLIYQHLNGNLHQVNVWHARPPPREPAR